MFDGPYPSPTRAGGYRQCSGKSETRVLREAAEQDSGFMRFITPCAPTRRLAARKIVHKADTDGI
jgi:hypothetical protein